MFCVGFGGEAELAGGALGSESFGQMEGCARTGCDGREGDESGQGEQTGGVVEAESEAELTGGGSEDAAAEGGVEGPETVELDGDGGSAGSGGDGAAPSANGFSGEEDLGEDAGELGLPAGFFVTGELGEIGEGLVDGRVEGAELGHQLVADAIAGVGDVGIGGVGAPGLVAGLEEGFDLGATGGQQRAKDTTRADGLMRCKGR